MSKIAIITINYNDQAGLRKTIESVVAQTFTNFEFIVIDGNSSDGSKAVIEQYKNQIAYSISEPDTGIYNAMNKGIRAATADYVLFMNAGDLLLENNTLEKAATLIDDRFDIIYGDIIWDDKIKNKKRREFFPEKLTFRFFAETSLPHQATFIKKSLFDTVFYYNEKLKIVSDWEFFMVAIVHKGARYKHIDLPICLYDQSGMSTNPENSKKILEEKWNAMREHFTFFADDYADIHELNTKRLQQFLYLRKFPIAFKIIKLVMNICLLFVPKMKQSKS